MNRIGVPVFVATLLFLAVGAGAEQVAWKCDFRPALVDPLTFVFESGALRGTILSTGQSSVMVHEGDNAVSFVETVNSGAVQTTTIYRASGEALHSRHTVMPLASNPFISSQIKGWCRSID